jgi:hypothetical protein
MTMTDTPESIPAKPAKRKRKARRTPRRASFQKPAAPKTPSEFAGMTNTACAAGCNIDGCVISRRPYCAHPCKTGLQAIDQNNVEALQRLRAAKKMLGIEDVEKQFS